MSKLRKAFIILISIVIVIIIGWFFRWDRFGFSGFKWNDGLKIGGFHYTGQYIGDERIVVPENLIGDKIGKVKFKLSGNVRNSYYRIRNMDAAILDKGTEIYEIINEEGRDKIAVKIENVFYLYLKE